MASGKALTGPASAWLAVGVGVVLLVVAHPWPLDAEALVRAAWGAAVAVMAWRVFITGRISRWRSIFFVLLAWSFIIHFKTQLIGLTGRAFVAPEVREISSCHIAQATSAVQYLYQQYLALTSGSWAAWSPLTWGAAWLLITLTLGQAWCAWACVYGGLDTGFSRLLRKPRWKLPALPPGLRELPAAILVAMLLLSLVAMRPIFCLWMCPLKLGTGFLDPDRAIRQLQMASFAGIGLLTLIIVPVLTGKRAFCGLVCPFGAWQSFFGRVNPYRVSIQPDRCTQCQRCLTVCPTWAISREGLRQHDISTYCNRCGDCMDACPTDAIVYRVAGAPGISATWARALFLITAWIVAGAVSMPFVPAALTTLARAVWP